MTGEFLGFLGSATEVDLPDDPIARGEFGIFRRPEQRPSTRPMAPLDMLADLTIVARMIAKGSDETELFDRMDEAKRIGPRI